MQNVRGLVYTPWQGNKSLLKLSSNNTLCVLFFNATKHRGTTPVFDALVFVFTSAFFWQPMQNSRCGVDGPHTMAACLCIRRGSVSSSTPRSGGNRISQAALKSRRRRRRDRDAKSVEGSGEWWGDIPLPIWLGGLGSVVSSPAGSGTEPRPKTIQCI